VLCLFLFSSNITFNIQTTNKSNSLAKLLNSGASFLSLSFQVFFLHFSHCNFFSFKIDLFFHWIEFCMNCSWIVSESSSVTLTSKARVPHFHWILDHSSFYQLSLALNFEQKCTCMKFGANSSNEERKCLDNISRR